MKITRESFKNIVRETMIEENEYQEFFKKALEKTGKSIPDMSDDEKKDFFNKIDSAWKGRGEKKNEGNAFGAAVSDAKEKGEDEFEVGGEKIKVEESVNESSSKEKEIYAKIEKLRVLSNAGKITGDQFLDKFFPLWKQLKGMKESVVNEKSSDPFLDFGRSKGKKPSASNRVDRVAKYGNYKFEFDDKKFIVSLLYNGKQIAYGYPNWSTGGYIMNHLSWGTKEKNFESLEDIIKYFKLKKITTDGLEAFNESANLKQLGESESVVKEDKYTVIDPKGNQLGTAGKNQVAMFAKKKGGEKAGYFVVSNKNALKARRTLEKFKGDFQNPKLKDIMAGLYESVKK